MCETPFTSCVHVKKAVHRTHHMYPTEAGKDHSYYYTIASNPWMAMLRCLTTPESEFLSSFYLCDGRSVAMSVVIRLAIISLVAYQTGLFNLLVSMILIRVSIMIFYFVAFYMQHTDVSHDIVPLGMNWQPTTVDILKIIYFGALSVEEGYGHEVHHTSPTLKPRYYNAIPTHTQNRTRL